MAGSPSPKSGTVFGMIWPHNIHTRHRHILAFLQTHLKTLYEYFPTARIFRKGKLVTYPISGMEILTSLSAWKLPFAAFGFAAARAGMYLKKRKRDQSFRDWIVNRFGGVIYREYFRDYPSKVWKLPTGEIDKHVAEARVPITGLLDILKALFRKPHREGSSSKNKNFYLKSGIGEMANHFERGLQESKVENGVAIQKILTDGGLVTAVQYSDATGAAKTQPCDFLLSTIPINALIPLFENVPRPRSARPKSWSTARRYWFL